MPDLKLIRMKVNSIFSRIIKFLRNNSIKESTQLSAIDTEKNIKLNRDARTNFKEFVDLLDDNSLPFLDQY